MIEHGIHCLPCSYINVIDLLPKQLWRHIDFKVTSSGCHSPKGLSITVGNFLVAMVTDVCRNLTYNSRIEWHTVYAGILSNYKSDAT